MFRQSSILGSTFFASREPVRNPLTLKILHSSRDMASKDMSLAGSMGHRLPRGLLVTTDTPLGNVSESDIVEVTDYDPVRNTSIVIGLKEPTSYVPLHWLALRTHPEHSVTLLLLMETVPEGVDFFSSRLLAASFEEAMEVAKAMKVSGKGVIYLEGRGPFFVAKDLDALKRAVRALLEPKKGSKGKKVPKRKKPKRKGTSKKKSGKKKARKVERKASKTKARKESKGRRPRSKQTRGKRKTHYKRGPTRRSSPRRQ
jgi:hypothetical protein